MLSARTLKQLLFIIHTAERADVEYWDNPQVYLVPGDEHVEAHFVLHNFKSTESLNTSQLKNLKIAGTLKYKVYILFRYQVNYLKVWCQTIRADYILIEATHAHVVNKHWALINLNIHSTRARRAHTPRAMVHCEWFRDPLDRACAG
jgi:hypothetical protein